MNDNIPLEVRSPPKVVSSVTPGFLAIYLAAWLVGTLIVGLFDIKDMGSCFALAFLVFLFLCNIAVFRA